MEWTNYQLCMPMTSTTLSWARPLRGGWYSFEWANVNRLGAQQGIYILWYPETADRPLQVAYVGQGIIKARIIHHRGSWSRIRHKVRARRLCLTWALVPDQKARDGIERYLAETLRPEVGGAWPAAWPVRVNLPDW